MKRFLKRLAWLWLIVLISLAPGCATLIQGSHQSIPISVQPAGASLKVNGSEYIAPVDVSLARNQDYQVVVSAPGYATQTAEIRSSFSGATFWDTIFVISWAVDLADGAAFKLEPETLQINLQPQPAAG
jgi:hypothetical protein